MTDDIDRIPSAWSAYMPILAGLFRAALAALGAAGFTWASAVTGSQIEMAAGVAMILGAAGWSAWQKVAAVKASRRQSVSSAIASADATMRAGTPVAVVVGPSPTSTTAADLNRDELARHQGRDP